MFVAVELRDARIDDRDGVERLLGEYLFEFDGRTGPYPDLDAYWEEPGHELEQLERTPSGP
jgi:hypothetical protein